MIVFELVGVENHPAYQKLAIESLDRQYSFLKSAVETAMDLQRPMLSLEVIKALNYHAISCLHAYAGEFRPCAVTAGSLNPPDFYRVPSLMNHFVDEVNRHWDAGDPVYLAAYVIWKLNHIHPFINGNGRTARALCHFVLCLKLGGWLAGAPIVPELIRQNRPEYVAALQAADASVQAGQLDLSVLQAFLTRLLTEQLQSANASAPPPPVT